jgi:hypothetical protein
MTLLLGKFRGNFFLTEFFYSGEQIVPPFTKSGIELTHLDSSGEKFNRRPSSGVMHFLL